MNKTTNVIAAAVMVMIGLGSCATSKQPAAKDADMNASKIVEIEKLDSEYLVLSDAQQSALRSINGMAFDLMRTQAGMDSKVVSPISVSYLMAMLANGANGATRAEIMKTLGEDDRQMDALTEVCKSLIDKASRLDSQTR
uniref:serpin family protein n=1 Tax=Prevotella sp. TaxID=59823 RepID=UPI004025F85A